MIRHQVIDGPRPLQAAEFERTIGLCNRVLRPHGPHTIAEEYPLVLTPDNAAHMWVIAAGDRIVSHAATYAATARLAEGVRIRIGGINSVATEPSFRRRGYASELVYACCEDLRKRGCHLAVLWTEVKGFYERLGFASLGSELLYRLTPADVRSLRGPDVQVRPGGVAQLEVLRDLRSRELPYFERTREEWRAYLSIPKVHASLAYRGERPTAYLIAGKGEDFRNCAHEWAGAPADVLALAAEATLRSPRRELILLAPDRMDGVNATLQRLPTPHIRTELGMFRCLDPEGLFAQVRPWMESRVGHPLTLARAGNEYVLSIGPTALSPLTVAAFCAMLLGPRRAREVFAGPAAAVEALDRALPLPLFIWGLDSV